MNGSDLRVKDNQDVSDKTPPRQFEAQKATEKVSSV